jgi:hypothetical protein
MEDIRIARETKSTQDERTVNTTSGLLVPQDRNRYSLVISAPATNTVTLSFRNPATLLAGIQLKSTDSPLTLTLEKHGEIVTRAIYGIVAAGSEPLGIWTSSLERQ